MLPDTDSTGILADFIEKSQKHNEQEEAHQQRLENHYERREVRYEDERARKCHQAFKTSAYEEQKNINSLPSPGTCKWVLDHQKFQSWRDSPRNDLLWISADPGCGKSVLSRMLVDQTFTGNDCNDHLFEQPSVCYFFFKDNETQDKLATALCAILHQLFSQQIHLIGHASPA